MRRVSGSPAAVCAPNAVEGLSTVGRPSRNRSGLRGTSSTGAATSSPRTSATGTAYDGTTRRGSQTIMASVVSTTAAPSASARIRFAVGS
jgi:hypothetical protein